ncbi:hypothetical protein [Treponema porcinum]|uniref:hypothetical protein n=1 Tax=Treponema porcinum TaxID=261392 RepID=UPI002355C336|nr:hypothetical protein [Treponema porcinum]MCI6323071.1 hypothetical protein [Treponema porcinum]
MKLKRFLAILMLSAAVHCGAFSQIYSQQQLIKAGHWIYDALFKLYAENARLTIADSAPLSVAELRLYFSKIDYESLSDSGRAVYREVQDFLYTDAFKFNFSGAFMGFNLKVEPELLYKSNSDLDWSFQTDYTGHIPHTEYKYRDEINYKDSEDDRISIDITKVEKKLVSSEYGATSAFNANSVSRPFATVPIYLGWGDIFMIETSPCFAKSWWAMTENDNFINLAYSGSYLDFLWPREAYGTAGWCFGKWGFNIHTARSGLQIGRTQTGSIIYNNSFETQSYVQLNLYSQYMKYNLDVVQIEKQKFMYLHMLDIQPFKWVRAGIVEGTLINEPFELRFLNPLMIMHSFGSWEDYSDDKEEAVYGESHVCAYMGVFVDIMPCRNLRIYGLYAQNEIQPPSEQGSANGRAMPDSLGGQLGFELTIPEKHGGYYTTALEGIYTTPYLYIKQGADWSLYSSRYNMQSNGSAPLCSWIGTPFGPDAAGFQAKFGYERLNRWNAEIQYLFLAHGTNSFGMFGSYFEDENGDRWWAYYPSVLRRLGILSDDESEDIARSYKLTGTVQFTNSITLKGYYTFNSHLRADAQAVYQFIINNRNVSGNFEQGIELAVSLTYNLF